MENNTLTKTLTILKTALTTSAFAAVINTVLFLLASTLGFLPKSTPTVGMNVSNPWVDVLFGTFFTVLLIGGIGSVIASFVFKKNAPTVIFVAAMLICLVSFFIPFTNSNLTNLTSTETFNFVAVYNLLHAVAAAIAAPTLAAVASVKNLQLVTNQTKENNQNTSKKK